MDEDEILLTERDWKILVEAVLNPPDPGPNLKAALEAYKKTSLRPASNTPQDQYRL